MVDARVDVSTRTNKQMNKWTMNGHRCDKNLSLTFKAYVYSTDFS